MKSEFKVCFCQCDLISSLGWSPLDRLIRARVNNPATGFHVGRASTRPSLFQLLIIVSAAVSSVLPLTLTKVSGGGLINQALFSLTYVLIKSLMYKICGVIQLVVQAFTANPVCVSVGWINLVWNAHLSHSWCYAHSVCVCVCFWLRSGPAFAAHFFPNASLPHRSFFPSGLC